MLHGDVPMNIKMPKMLRYQNNSVIISNLFVSNRMDNEEFSAFTFVLALHPGTRS